MRSTSDIRGSPLFLDAQEIAQMLLRPETGIIVDASDLDVAADGTRAVFAGVIMDQLVGSRATRICGIDLKSGATQVLTSGPNCDRDCKFSPNSEWVAFASDRGRPGDFQLYLFSPTIGATRPTQRVSGWVEYLHWSPDGKQLLLGVAEHGADTAGAHGGIAAGPRASDTQSWMPQIQNGESSSRRSVWVYSLSDNVMRQVTGPNINIWEANWCGPSALVAVASARADEGAWYSATLNIVEIRTGAIREIYRCDDQLGWPSASPTGECIALVQAVCSDRWCVSGDLILVEVKTGAITRVPTNGADVCHIRWYKDDARLLLGSRRGFESVVLEYDLSTRSISENWSSSELAGVGLYLHPLPFGSERGSFVLLGEGYHQAPHIAIVRHGVPSTVCRFNAAAEPHIQGWLNKTERMTWTAPDGLEIQGWLLLPTGTPPFPTVMSIHGGPVLCAQPQWYGRSGTTLATIMLLKRGYAVFQPNPRGSAGRGQAFARKVKGDMNGADTLDLLSGVDNLIKRGTADALRLGVMGGSYGGNMTCWLVTQDDRFAAAVAVAPHSDQVSQHLMSNIPEFDEIFIGERFNDPNGKYYQRSAIMHAHRTKTPTLCVAGALDRCTPPNQAAEFYNALRLHGVSAELIVYPEEGHGVRHFPAMLDFAARVVGWFERHVNGMVES